MSEIFYAVDRLEGQLAVLVSDNGTMIELSKKTLPPRVKEGTMLRVKVSHGKPDWTTAKIDETERLKRLNEARQRLDQLAKDDPGGDITV